MSEAKHAPGPWSARHKRVTVSVLDADGNYVTENVRAHPKQEANACLIAAAPDLLAACEIALVDLRQELADLGSCDHTVNICYCGLKSDIETVESAIKAAKGEA